MNTFKIEDIKTSLNNWAVGDFQIFKNLRHYIQDIVNGNADEEIIAVLSTMDIIEGFRGWQIMLPKTVDVLNSNLEKAIKFYEWKEDFDYSNGTPVVWQIPSNWEEWKTENFPPVVNRLIGDMCYISEHCNYKMQSV